jgi:spermidine synthase
VNQKRKVSTLLASVFMIAICGILYELLISTITSYFQGSSILHFSIVIGLFLSFMGVGSFISKYIQEDLPVWFVRFEIVLSLVGGFSAFLLYFAFSMTAYFYGFAFLIIAILGAMIGVEIPILTRIVSQYDNIKDALANVLSFDYLGSLIASVAFPLLLLPMLGTMRTAFAIGIVNLGVAVMNTFLFKKELKRFKQFIIGEIVLGVVLIAGFIYSFQINAFYENYLYRDQVMLSEQSKYQNIVVTRWNKDLRLFINGNLQFSSMDEYRYHEPLVHVPMNLTTHREKVLILGGGDGLAVRELLKYKDIGQIDLVDLDPEITDLGKNHPVFTKLNENSLSDEKVKIFNQDAYKFIEKSPNIYNVIIIDLPDPSNESLGKLYSKEFYGLIKKVLAADGVVVTQSTSPYFAPDAFWCIHNTMDTVFETTIPYQTYVPTFGQWGFNVAVDDRGRFPNNAPPADVVMNILKENITKEGLTLKYMNPDMLPSMFVFGEDRKEKTTEINKLQSQILIGLYEKNWDSMR